MIVIYKHTSPSGKSYIGQTRNLKRRNREHRNCQSHLGNCHAFKAAVVKYGWDNITTIVLGEYDDQETANQAEGQFIDVFGTLVPNGYNIREGGEVQCHHPDTIRKISEAHKGKKHSSETLAKMSASKIGIPTNRHIPCSEEHKQRLSEIRTGTVQSAETIEKRRQKLVGKRHTDETKDIIRAIRTGTKQSPEALAKRTATRETNRLRKLVEQDKKQTQDT